MDGISPDEHDRRSLTPRCKMANKPAEPNRKDVNSIHAGNMFDNMVPEGVKFYRTILKDKPLTTILCYPLSGAWNTHTTAAAHHIEQGLEHAYLVEDPTNAFIDDNGKKYNRDITSPSLSKTGNQVTRIFLICKLGLDLAFTLCLHCVFANRKIAFIVVNPSTAAPITQYIRKAVGSGIRLKEDDYLTDAVKDKIHKNSTIRYLVVQSYKAQHDNDAPANLLEESIASMKAIAVECINPTLPGIPTYDFHLYAPSPVGPLFHKAYIREVIGTTYVAKGGVFRITRPPKCGYCSVRDHAKPECPFHRRHGWFDTVEAEELKLKEIDESRQRPPKKQRLRQQRIQRVEEEVEAEVTTMGAAIAAVAEAEDSVGDTGPHPTAMFPLCRTQCTY
jgi:hypothetical protein